jgi:hypothetical protein
VSAIHVIQSKVDLVAEIDAGDVVKGLNNNDELIFAFVLEMMDAAGSSELEERLQAALKERSELS